MMKSFHKLTIILLLIPTLTFGIGKTYKKRQKKSKKIAKSFTVNSDATLNIDNKYGDINITTWAKNTIEIDVEITIKGDDVGDVENQLEKIDIEFNDSPNLVEVKTIFKKNKSSWSWWGKSKKVSYKIIYTVKMPISNNVKLANDYGAISLSELNGEASINCDYGKISIGDLRGNNTDINLDYCSTSTINSMKDGNVNIDYSKLTIESATDLKLNADYSSFKLAKATNLDFNIDYGSLAVNEITNATGNGDYTALKFGTVKNNLKVKSDYGSIKIENLANGFESVTIDSEYAGIKIGTSATNNFSFIIDLQYAGFKRNNDNIELLKSIVKNSKKYYEGIYGKGNSNSKIIIKSEYGSVTFSEN